MTYALARIWLGSITILLWAGISVTCLWLGCGSSVLDDLPLTGPSFVLLLALGHLLLSLPLDWVGGQWLPEKHGQPRDGSRLWWRKWIRASLVQAILFGLLGCWLLLVGQYLGRLGSVGGMALTMLILAGMQVWVARASLNWETFLDNSKGKRVFYLDNTDPGFTGGISGIPGMEVLVLPKKWRDRMTEKMLKVLLARRHGAIQTIAHARGFLVAFLWNVAAFAVAVFLSPEGTSTGAGLIQTVAGFSLLSLLGSGWVLPWLSRRAVWEIDRWVFYRGGDADVLRQSFSETFPAGEIPARIAPWLSLVVAMPYPQSRLDHLATQLAYRGAWHSARQATFFSWAGLNLFTRAYPTLVGLPERWVFLPGD